MSKNKPKKAQAWAGEAVLLDNTSHSARWVLAQALEKLGNLDEAASEYRQVSKSKASWKVRRSARRALARVKKAIKKKKKSK